MPRLTRQPLVALLAALAALLAPVGATAAGSVAAAVRQAVVGGSAGAVHATSQPPAGRVTAGREWRDTAARRAQHGTEVAGDEVDGSFSTGSGLAGQSSVGHAPAGLLVGLVLLVAAGWWVRRGSGGTVPSGRTTGIRCGRGPPALACA